MQPVPANERVLSCRILRSILLHESSLVILQNPETTAGFNAALVQELCFGVCRWYHRLDFFAQHLLEKPLRTKDTDVRCLILLGLYQLFFLRIADHAAVNETVAAADQLGKAWARNLVNAVLREAQRQGPQLLELAGKDYAVWYSHPEWMLAQLKRDWPAHYRTFLEGNNAKAPMTLRVNAGRCSRTEYLQILLQAGIGASAGKLCDTAIILDQPCDVRQLPGFLTGSVSVQDEASQLVARLLPLAPGLRVLDACAAPGGKTCALLEAEPGLELLALDRDERRLPRLQENLARLGLCAEVACADITANRSLAPGSFDRILLDVPCSATGVIRRHPDIKLLRTPAEVEELVSRQARLLDAAWALLKSGGYLLYSTCSVLAAENSLQITRFLQRTPGATSMALTLSSSIPCETGVQLAPGEDQHDGFYYALLQKY